MHLALAAEKNHTWSLKQAWPLGGVIGTVAPGGKPRQCAMGASGLAELCLEVPMPCRGSQSKSTPDCRGPSDRLKRGENLYKDATHTYLYVYIYSPQCVSCRLRTR